MWIPHLSIEDAIAKYASGQKSFAQNILVDFLAAIWPFQDDEECWQQIFFWLTLTELKSESVSNQPTNQRTGVDAITSKKKTWDLHDASLWINTRVYRVYQTSTTASLGTQIWGCSHIVRLETTWNVCHSFPNDLRTEKSWKWKDFWLAPNLGFPNCPITVINTSNKKTSFVTKELSKLSVLTHHPAEIDRDVWAGLYSCLSILPNRPTDEWLIVMKIGIFLVLCS